MARSIILILLLALLLLLQYRLWIGEGSLQELNQLEQAVTTQSAEVAALQERNRGLRAEVADLRGEGQAVEERARSDLGMIKQDETFFLVVEEKEPDASGKREEGDASLDRPAQSTGDGGGQ